MDSGYSLYLKEVFGLLCIRRLPIGRLLAIGIVRICPDEVSRFRYVFADHPASTLVCDGRVDIGLTEDGELAGFVIAQVIYRLPPRTVHLAYRRVAKKRLHIFVLGC